MAPLLAGLESAAPEQEGETGGRSEGTQRLRELGAAGAPSWALLMERWPPAHPSN